MNTPNNPNDLASLQKQFGIMTANMHNILAFCPDLQNEADNFNQKASKCWHVTDELYQVVEAATEFVSQHYSKALIAFNAQLRSATSKAAKQSIKAANIIYGENVPQGSQKHIDFVKRYYAVYQLLLLAEQLERADQVMSIAYALNLRINEAEEAFLAAQNIAVIPQATSLTKKEQLTKAYEAEAFAYAAIFDHNKGQAIEIPATVAEAQPTLEAWQIANKAHADYIRTIRQQDALRRAQRSTGQRQIHA